MIPTRCIRVRFHRCIIEPTSVSTSYIHAVRSTTLLPVVLINEADYGFVTQWLA